MKSNAVRMTEEEFLEIVEIFQRSQFDEDRSTLQGDLSKSIDRVVERLVEQGGK